MRKVLILAYSFPPAGGGRVRRAVKFVKYLPLFNWQPIVLTAKKPTVNFYDYTLLDQLPKDLTVIRTPSLEFAYPYYKIKQLDINLTQKNTFGFNSLIMVILNKIKPWLCIPDSRIGWIPFALFKGINIIKKERIDAIMVIAEPFSSFISGVMLKFFCRKPLVLDFRDEWSENNKYLFVEKNIVIRKIEDFLEAICIRYSDKVISVTENIIDNFRRRYQRYEDKFIYISNGFDPEDFSNLKESEIHDGLFTVSYAGAVYQQRSPKYFFKAIADLVNEQPEISKIIRINFMGEIMPEIEQLIKKDKLKGIVTVFGFLSHKDALDRLKNSDVLLYIEDDVRNSDRILPAKLFEYMGIKKPILALAGDGVVKNTVIKSKIGLVANPKDPSEIKKTLFVLYETYHKKKTEFCPDENFINQFHRKKITAKLVSTLESLIK